MSDDIIGSSPASTAPLDPTMRYICNWTRLDGPTVTTFISPRNQFESTHEWRCPWWGFNHGSNEVEGHEPQPGSTDFLQMYGKIEVHRMLEEIDLKFPDVAHELRAKKRAWAYATMYQSWLTFGLLEDVLARRVAREELLVETAGTEQPIWFMSTKGLRQMMREWVIRIKTAPFQQGTE